MVVSFRLEGGLAPYLDAVLAFRLVHHLLETFIVFAGVLFEELVQALEEH